jgi:hypothetical protein
LLAIQNLLGVFNERDQIKRLAQMQWACATDITIYDPNKVVVGFDAIDIMVSQLLDSNPGWSFSPVGKLWVNSDMVTLEWKFGPNGETAPVRGKDIMVVNEEMKIQKMYTMIKGVSDHHLGGGSGM